MFSEFMVLFSSEKLLFFLLIIFTKYKINIIITVLTIIQNPKQMKILKKLFYLLIIVPFMFSSCTKDDTTRPAVLNSKVFALSTVELRCFWGTATVVEKSDATLSINYR
jgi:hypothetical protein